MLLTVKRLKGISGRPDRFTTVEYETNGPITVDDFLIKNAKTGKDISYKYNICLEHTHIDGVSVLMIGPEINRTD